MNPFDDPSQKGDDQRFGDHDDWDDGDPDELEEESSSGEEPEEPRAGKRPRGASYGGKYPASRRWMKKERAQAQTDLAAYFGPVPAQQQVAICRAYASYLAAQNRGMSATQKKTSE